MRRFHFFVCVTVAFSMGPQPGVKAQQIEPFSFGKVELDVLAQVDLLDQKFEREGFVFADAGVDGYLAGIEHRLLSGTPSPERVQWRIRVLRDPLANAFALPNGSIYLNSGLIALMDDDDQLASVVAHEMVHVWDRQLDRKPKDAQKVATRLGTKSPRSALGTRRNTLVFVRSRGVMLTGGKKTFGWMVAGPKTHGNVTRIALVDSRTGDLLFLTVLRRSGNFLEHPEKTFKKAIADAFRKHLGAPAPGRR